ncbi:MAG TPA: PAS domain-containing protein, partial [Gemmatimonadaceae bacterium]|nr:PAS domain-containing protein [Gemmatimonadaceae bacterium]
MGGAPIDQWNERVHPDDVELVESKWRACVASGEPFEHSYRWRMHDGTFHWHASRRVPLRDATGKIIRWYSSGYDIEDQKRAEALLAGEKRLLEMVANDHPLSETLEALCRLVESTAAGSSCSVVLVDPSGTTLEEAIAPSLPTEFNEAVRGWPVERLGGPCQGAARDKTQIIMSDVESDTRWRTSWRALAQKHGLRSCWSTPLMSRAGKVLGTFALYQREPATPSRRQLELIEQFTSVASIAIERAQRDNALRQSEARRAEAERELQLTIDTIPAFVTVFRPDGEREYVNKTWRDNTGLQVADVQHGAWTRIVHTEDQERSERLWRSALESGEPFEIEQRIRRHDGVYRWHLGRRAPLRDDSGNILRWYSVAIDIDDQKRAEDARRRSEAELAEAKRELELTIDTIPTLIASYWPNGERDFVSKNWQAYTGISQEEARGKSSTNTFHPDRRDTGEIVWQACLASGKPYEAIERLRRADGEYRWHWIRRVPLRDEAGKIIKWYGVGQDIEHQKQAEAALLNSEARLTEAERELRLTLDSIPTITWRAAPNGYVQQLNRQWFEYTGTTPEQVRGWRWKLCVHPDDLEQLVEIGTQYVTSGTSIDSEARLRRHDGEYRWFLFRPAAARDESGNIVAWYGTISDIEDRKRAEQKALEAEREVQRMLDSIPAMIVRGGTNGYIQYFSKQWFDYTGTTLDTQRGFRWWESLHPDDKDRVVEFGARFVASGVTGDCEARLRCFDGTYRWFLFRPAPIHDGAGNFTGWYGTVTDIEEQKRAEQALVTSERNLQLTFDTMPAIAWAANPDGSADFFNQNYL